MATNQEQGSKHGAAARGRATEGERESPRQLERPMDRGGGAPEVTDPNYATRHPDVGHEGKAGKASASSRDVQSRAARGEQPRNVRDVMTPTVEVCTPATELYYVARMMADRDVGAIPVVEHTDSMKPIGIVTDRDIVVRGLAKRQDVNALRAGDCMSSGVITVTPGDSIDHALDRMRSEQVRRLVVVDDGGRCVGILAQADLARQAGEEETAELLRDVSQPDGDAEQRRYR